MKKTPSRYNTAALLAGFVLIWGTGYWPTEVASEHTGTVLLSGLRVIGSALFLVALAWFSRSKWPKGPMLIWATTTGLLMIALSHWGTTESVIRAGPGTGAVLVNSAPLIVVALGWVSLRERLSLLGLAGVAIGFGGVVLMVSSQIGGGTENSQLLIGVGLGAAGAVGWAIGTLILRSFTLQRSDDLDMLSFTATQFVVAGVVLLISGFSAEGVSSTNWGSTALWASLVWIGPLSGLGFACFFGALSRMPAAHVSAPMFLVPAVAVIVEIARGNSPTALVLLGMSLAVFGVGLINVQNEMLVNARSYLQNKLQDTKRHS